ncbi:chymotrypsin-1-like [Cydia pomonella]|uniref:chymotrypsin-1-like n=1 Tax=Cydia pomonella TaxID=82600 RepID=UPI002ADE6EBC|nr:chymotrypsin-1-like [Cydia pomonella]
MFQIFLLSFAVISSADKMSPFIVGGNEVSIKNWPFVAFVQITGSYVPAACGGSLLSSQTVLTAAHCLDDLSNKKKVKGVQFRIFMGHTLITRAKLTRSVLDYETHRNYSPVDRIPQFDIGIMFLSRPVQFGPEVKKAILQRKFNANIDKKLAVAGWGRTDTYKFGDISKRLKAVMVKLETNNICKRLTGVICTQHFKEFPYTGDSGGPMVNANNLLQLGIVSFRLMKTGTSGFTSIPYYWDWINKTQLKLFERFCKTGK